MNRFSITKLYLRFNTNNMKVMYILLMSRKLRMNPKNKSLDKLHQDKILVLKVVEEEIEFYFRNFSIKIILSFVFKIMLELTITQVLFLILIELLSIKKYVLTTAISLRIRNKWN